MQILDVNVTKFPMKAFYNPSKARQSQIHES